MLCLALLWLIAVFAGLFVYDVGANPVVTVFVFIFVIRFDVLADVIINTVLLLILKQGM
jgi:hypothetical protein